MTINAINPRLAKNRYLTTANYIIATAILFLITGPAVFPVRPVMLSGGDIGPETSYWFRLNRRENIETLNYGPNNLPQLSLMVWFFRVKTGVPGQKPTPLPQKTGRPFWLVIDKYQTRDNPETAPFFLVLDVPGTETSPFGPRPYRECAGQCNWKIPGYFGLHGVAGVESRLTIPEPGSSGCVRHRDFDISFLYHVLDPRRNPIPYFIPE